MEMMATFRYRPKSLVKFALLLCVLIGSVCVAIAARGPASAQRSAPDVRVLVGDITDKRTTGQFFAECEVELKIIGDTVADSLGLRAVRIRSAVDDTGRDLKKEEEESSSSGDISTEPKLSFQTTVKLKNPARSAKFIKSLEGDVELFQPTPANGGLIVEKRFMARPNVPLTSPGLKKWNVRITYMTKEGLEAKKKELEEQREKAMEGAGEKMGEAFAELFQGLFGGMMSDDENSLHFVIEDPDARVLSLAFRDAKGKPIESNSRMRSGPLHSYGFAGDLPGPDAQLVIYLATPESLKVVPFKLDNIPLP
jgi:hypothetical protein